MSACLSRFSHNDAKQPASLFPYLGLRGVDRHPVAPVQEKTLALHACRVRASHIHRHGRVLPHAGTETLVDRRACYGTFAHPAASHPAPCARGCRLVCRLAQRRFRRPALRPYPPFPDAHRRVFHLNGAGARASRSLRVSGKATQEKIMRWLV